VLKRRKINNFNFPSQQSISKEHEKIDLWNYISFKSCNQFHIVLILPFTFNNILGLQQHLWESDHKRRGSHVGCLLTLMKNLLSTIIQDGYCDVRCNPPILRNTYANQQKLQTKYSPPKINYHSIKPSTSNKFYICTFNCVTCMIRMLSLGEHE